MDPLYAAKFAEITNQKEGIPFVVMAFTSLEKLKDYARKNPIEILLIGSETAKESVELLPIGKIFRLSEGETVTIKEEIPKIYKYQSSDAILREVMECYGTNETEWYYCKKGKKAQMLGVYSPVSRCLKTSFALTLGQLLSMDGRILYVNLECFSGFRFLMGEEFQKDLADVLYFYKQGKVGMLKLQSVIHHLGQMDYIPPVRYPEDLDQIEAEELAKMLDQIAREGGYESMILDIGNYGRQAEKLLEICDVIYMPVREDGMSEAKIEEMETYLKHSGHQKILENIIRLKLPFHSHFGRKENYVEQLLWGELGDYVRKIIKGKGLECV